MIRQLKNVKLNHELFEYCIDKLLMNIQTKKKCDRGFTLIEMTIVLVIVGIIAAIASPNFLGLLSRIKVNNALEELLGAVKETQRLAMRSGNNCRININPNTNILNATTNECSLNTRKIDENIVIRTNLSGSIPSIPFSYKGTTTKMGTIVLSSQLTNIQKCFVISLGLGIMRTGNYTGSKNGSVSASNCQKLDS